MSSNIGNNDVATKSKGPAGFVLFRPLALLPRELTSDKPGREHPGWLSLTLQHHHPEDKGSSSS